MTCAMTIEVCFSRLTRAFFRTRPFVVKPLMGLFEIPQSHLIMRSEPKILKKKKKDKYLERGSSYGNLI